MRKVAPSAASIVINNERLARLQESVYVEISYINIKA